MKIVLNVLLTSTGKEDKTGSVAKDVLVHGVNGKLIKAKPKTNVKWFL